MRLRVESVLVLIPLIRGCGQWTLGNHGKAGSPIGKKILDILTVNCYIQTMDEKKYSIEELAGISGFSVRTIRYYIQEGLLDPPPGRGRGGFYFNSHLQRLREIKALQDQGLKLASIQEILRKEGKLEAPASDREVWVKYTLAPGIEVYVSRESEEQERRKISEIIRIARSILDAGGGKNE